MKTFKQSTSSFIEVAALLSLLSHKEPLCETRGLISILVRYMSAMFPAQIYKAQHGVVMCNVRADIFYNSTELTGWMKGHKSVFFKAKHPPNNRNLSGSLFEKHKLLSSGEHDPLMFLITGRARKGTLFCWITTTRSSSLNGYHSL